LQSIPKQVAPRTDVLAWGVRAEGSSLLPFYNADGTLQFVYDIMTCRVVEAPVPVEEEMSAAEYAVFLSGFLHGQADDREASRRGHVYFLGGDEGPIKIGHSSCVAARFRDIQACSPVPLKLFATRQGGPIRESAYHALYAAHRLHGEWFERHPDILAEIESLQVSS
jgi:hypothetical protein